MINEIICGDCIGVMKNINSDMVSLTICSPPYNVKLSYNSCDDNMPYHSYLAWLKDVFSEVYRITRNGGRCCINIDAVTNRQEDKDREYIRNTYSNLSILMKEIGWKFRTEICWYKQNAVGKRTAWGSYMSCSNPTMRRTHEWILVWSKGDWKLDGDPELSDITKKEFCEYTLSTWFMSPETRNLANHPASFPEELPRRLIKLYSYRGDVILDPFVGTGTTSVVANGLFRKYIGIDMDKDYCDYARGRIEAGKDIFAND